MADIALQALLSNTISFVPQRFFSSSRAFCHYEQLQGMLNATRVYRADLSFMHIAFWTQNDISSEDQLPRLTTSQMLASDPTTPRIHASICVTADMLVTACSFSLRLPAATERHLLRGALHLPRFIQER